MIRTQPDNLHPLKKQLIDEYNSKKTQITSEIDACKNELELQLVTDSYPQFAKITSYKKMLTDKFATLQ